MNLHLGYVLRRHHIHAGPGCIGQQNLTDVYGGGHQTLFSARTTSKIFSFGMSLRVLQLTAGRVPPVTRTVVVTMRVGAVWTSLRA